MYALTLNQPWAFAITDLGKDVENRTWKPPARLLGQRFAIHAAERWSADGLIQMLCVARQLGLGSKIPGLSREQFTKSAIVATVRMVGWCTEDELHLVEKGGGPGTFGGLKGSTMWSELPVEAHVASDSPWFGGPIAFLLADMRKLRTPLYCTGRQRFWKLTEQFEQKITEAGG